MVDVDRPAAGDEASVEGPVRRVPGGQRGGQRPAPAARAPPPAGRPQPSSEVHVPDTQPDIIYYHVIHLSISCLHSNKLYVSKNTIRACSTAKC